MAAKRRDTTKISEGTDHPARKPRKRQQADRQTKTDFGDLAARPTAPPRRAAKGRKLMADRGPSEEIDLPASFTFSFGTRKRR